MSELVPAGPNSATSPSSAPMASSLSGGPQPDMLARLQQFVLQEPVRKALPLFLALCALGIAALAWTTVAPSPQRLLYANLDDADRASVIATLEQASVSYEIDNRTGALSVAEEDFYRARMLVASDGGLAAPESGAAMLDSLPMGASRMLEGERLRTARERDLVLTIREINGVESVRVHLAEGEKSVFVRDNVAPSASVMVRLARGRQLSAEQVGAIVNLVAGSVPGLSVDAVRVVDQNGRLLSEREGSNSDRLDLQSRVEQKLRTQVAQLLTPMLGAGNFSSEIQVELDLDEVTSARERYDKEGSVRSESQASSQSASGSGNAIGVPGVLSNTPPPSAQAQDRPPLGTMVATEQVSPVNGESRSSRTYELGREVSVENSAPGKVRHLSVAVAINKEAMKDAKPEELEQIKQLVGAAVGANGQRGDTVQVVVRSFKPASEEPAAFYEASWFLSIVRYIAALIAVLLVLFLGVRPMIKALRKDSPAKSSADDPHVTELHAEPHSAPASAAVDAALLNEKVSLAQRLIAEKPDDAVAALRQMLNDTVTDGEAAEAAA